MTSGTGNSLPVTVVVARTPRPGREADLSRWAQGVAAAAGRFPGHLGAHVHEPSPPDRDELVIVFGFATAAQLAAWEDSAERAEWLRRADQLSEGGQRTQAVETIAALFATPGRATVPPPRWKSATVVALALYPLSLLVASTLAPHLTGLPVALRSLVTTLVVVPLMVWVAVPAVSRLLHRWLVGR